MRVADRLTQREASWRELERLVDQMSERHIRRCQPADVLRLGQLYRGVCSDLMLAESYDLPRDTVAYLHGLVGRAHNVLYRAQGFRSRDWGRVLFDSAPRTLRSDPALRLAAAVFVVSFLICALVAAAQPEFARQVVGEKFLESIDHMYSRPIESLSKEGTVRDDTAMAGFYIQHNTAIGLKCFAWGILFGVGSLFQLLSNGIVLGTLFGHMAVSPHASSFFTFVTAHTSFELTAIVVAGAAG
ncbi:MAG: stage II sporulation protein M, partial [Planctomycetaceae bacterium]|nr:stage II sporulation protein M [Planctomycetaceae bacterium]